jgi:methylmalonyl-CoA/ethylmalonyl-CoA epimerase
MQPELNLNFHHVGIAVNRIDEAVDSYVALFGAASISPVYTVVSQQVKVCFVNIGNGSFIELVEPTSEESGIHRLRKKGYTYYHIAYLTDDIETTVNKLVQLNYKAMDFFNSEAFDGKRCVFLFSPEAHLIELIEK